MQAKTVVISGIGIAGPTLAYWLAERGLAPMLVERAPQLRTSGYIIDFWGVGYDIAEKMGLLPEIHREGYDVRELRLVVNLSRQSFSPSYFSPDSWRSGSMRLQDLSSAGSFFIRSCRSQDCFAQFFPSFANRRGSNGPRVLRGRRE